MTRLIIFLIYGMLLLASGARAEEIYLSCTGSHPDSAYLEFNVSINENKRLNGIGNLVIKYINDYAIKNKNDVIFGHIPQNADFTKDSRESFLPNIDMIKYWLKDKGYSINNDNNDFHKIINNSDTLKE